MASIAFMPQISTDATAALSGSLKGTNAAGRRAAERSEATQGAGAATIESSRWPLASLASARAAKAKANGEDFEAMFLNSMMQHMFEGVGKGPFSGGQGASMWRSFLTDEYSKSFVKAGGIGLAKEVERALLAQQEIK